MEKKMKVGDILQSSWGYEQTNVDFYEVVKATKAMVTVRRIAGKMLPSEDGYSAMSGFTVPVPGAFVEDYRAKELRRKVLNGGSIRINDYAYAHLIEPKEDGSYPRAYVSWYH
jgi:hypothetical protein